MKYVLFSIIAQIQCELLTWTLFTHTKIQMLSYGSHKIMWKNVRRQFDYTCKLLSWNEQLSYLLYK